MTTSTIYRSADHCLIDTLIKDAEWLTTHGYVAKLHDRLAERTLTLPPIWCPEYKDVIVSFLEHNALDCEVSGCDNYDVLQNVGLRKGEHRIIND